MVFQIGIEEHKQWSLKSQARSLATQLCFFHANASMSRLIYGNY